MQALRLSVCLIAVLSSVVLGLIWRFSMDMIIVPTYPRLELPTASRSTRYDYGRGSVVSLSREGKWIHDDKEMRTEDELRSALTMRGEAFHELGSTATIRVRIGNDATARHFLKIHRIAVECGYDEMRVSVVEPKRMIGRF